MLLLQTQKPPWNAELQLGKNKGNKMTEQQTQYEAYPESPAVPHPPHSAEAEAGLLGSILLDGRKQQETIFKHQITEESFHIQAHRMIFSNIIDMLADQSKEIDLVTVIEHMQHHPADKKHPGSTALDAIGGPFILEQLITNTPTVAHAEYYAGIIAKHHKRRQIIDLTRNIEKTALTGEEAPEAILDTLEQQLMQLTGTTAGTQHTWQETLSSTMATINRLISGDRSAAGIPTGIENIDLKLIGLRPADLIIIAARPSQGKTSLVMNIAENISLGRIPGHTAHNVAIFSLEMSGEALAMRMLTGRAEISSHHIYAGQHVSKEYEKRLKLAHEALSNARLHIDEEGALDVDQLRIRARRMKKKHNISLIIIDYLQLLNSAKYGKHGRQIETMYISGQLKAMAKELNIPVIALSQLSRAPESRDGRPRLSDLRDSGAIEQDADIVAMLRRPAYYHDRKYADNPDLAILDFAKHRNGPIGQIFLNFDAAHTKFTPASDPTRTLADQDLMPPNNHKEIDNQPEQKLFGYE